MLVVDPTKRITFPQVRQHKWFKVNLPEYSISDRNFQGKKTIL